MTNRMDPKETISQLGRGFTLMTGAKNFVIDREADKLTFRIGRNDKGVNVVEITLNAMDTYDVRYLRVWGSKVTVKAEDAGVYGDMLSESFERATGMVPSMPRVFGRQIELPVGAGGN